MRNGSNKIRVSRIYKRFILSFLVVLLLPVSCFAVIFLQNYRELYREKVLNLAENSLEASVMELERIIESLESFVAYNLMADTISESVLLKDYMAMEISNIISAEMIAQPALESISYYNTVTPDTVYVIDGTYELKYYATSYMWMENKEHLLDELNDLEKTGWTVWERRNATREGSDPALMYISRTWKNDCWLFLIATDKLEEIINTEQSVTVLQNNEGIRLFPFVSEERSDVPAL